MSVMSQTYSIIINRGISAPGHGKEVADGHLVETPVYNQMGLNLARAKF